MPPGLSREGTRSTVHVGGSVKTERSGCSSLVQNGCSEMSKTIPKYYTGIKCKVLTALAGIALVSFLAAHNLT